MATATFDRTFIVDTPEAQKKLMEIMTSNDKVQPRKREAYTTEELKKNAEIVKQCLFH